jgi:endonuclease/exonuclease/phosphatase family metal-dependent hydrolase
VRATLAALLLVAAWPAAGVEFSVLTYNTHGLPSWIAGDEPEARFPRIGALANAYDVVLLQEDFDHHDALRADTRHSVVERGNPSRESWHCWVSCSGSGLTFLSALSGQRVLALSNVPYGVCAGWISGANDCFATKGFQHARVEIAPGLLVHFVNTHLDAGGRPEDREARRQQLALLGDHLKSSVDGDPLVLAGDLNLDAAQPADARMLSSFTDALGLENSGAAATPGGGWEVLDYVYYRPGSATGLRVLDAGEATEFAEAGVPLSDHPALFVRFEAYRRLAVPPSTGITAPVR